MDEIVLKVNQLIDQAKPEPDHLKGIADRLVFDEINNEKDFVFNELALQYTKFYEDCITRGIPKETAAKVVVKIQQTAIASALKKNLVGYFLSVKTLLDGSQKRLEDINTDITKLTGEVRKLETEHKNMVEVKAGTKKSTDFIMYLQYASDKWADDIQKDMIQKLIEKIPQK